jgi:hypothetical protein
MDKKSINGKFGIWLSNLEIDAIRRALKWYDNCAISFKDDSKTAIMRLLVDDLNKIQSNGPQIEQQSDDNEFIYEEDVMKNICEECE